MALLGLTFTLRPTRTFTVAPHYTVGLHSWFLDQARRYDPDLSQAMHDGQSEKPFTLSGLIGNFIPQDDRQLLLSPDHTYHWTITGLNPAVTNWMQTWQQELPTTLRLQRDTLKIENCAIALSPTTYEALWDNAATKVNVSPSPHDLCFTFASPTSFRHCGNHLPLPIPDILFHSYVRRWNHFAHLEVDREHFKQWVDEHVVIARHNIQSQKVQAGKQGSVTGFTGTIQFHLTPKAQAEPDYVQMIYALEQLAPYCGTGHKTTFGLGQTHLGWHLQPSKPRTPNPQPQTPNLKLRITALTALFIAIKKRQGGDRARHSAELWATIVARRETGESISAIAADLDMNPETVKKYNTLAQRTLRALESSSDA
jgi:CRISPR-associated endoribonuclease Cas6